MFRIRAMLATLVMCGVTAPLFAGYNIQVNKVSDFGSSFLRIAVLPAATADGIDPLWVEELLFGKLVSRRIRVIPVGRARQAMFDLGISTLTSENMRALAESLHVDAFIIPTVGGVGKESAGAVAIPLYGGGAIAAPIEINRGSIELSIVAAETGKVLMHGVAGGESGWRSTKGVVGTMFDKILDRCFTAEFRSKYNQPAAK